MCGLINSKVSFPNILNISVILIISAFGLRIRFLIGSIFSGGEDGNGSGNGIGKGSGNGSGKGSGYESGNASGSG